MPGSRTFDITLANELARLESYNKHYYRPNTYLHKWWGRRCGTTFRMILKHLVDDEKLRDYYLGGGLEGKIVMDPMMGGGTSLHEAVRLGANVIGIDVDPIPVLQAFATLSNTRIDSLESAFEDLHWAIRSELEPLFKSSCPICSAEKLLRFILYGQKRRCRCREVIMVDSLKIRQKANGSFVTLCPQCHAVIDAGEICNCGTEEIKPPLVDKQKTRCAVCREPYLEDTSVPYYRRYEALVTVGDCPSHGIQFATLVDQDRALMREADAKRGDLAFHAFLEVGQGPKSRVLLQKNIKSYDELFSSRQLIYLHRAIKAVRELEADDGLFLGLLVSTSLDFNSMLCGFKGVKRRRAGAIRHTFSHHGYSFPYTALEANPVFPKEASGTLFRLFNDRVRKARQWSEHPRERKLDDSKEKFAVIEGEIDQGTFVESAEELEAGNRRCLIVQGSASNLDLKDGIVDFIVTDPPYYDSVHYADLSAFFRTWLRQLVSNRMVPDLLWDYDNQAGAEDIPGSATPGETKSDHYLRIMSQIFCECNRVLRPDKGRLVFSFHHWDPAAWSSLAVALKHAGFVLLEAHVVHSESPISVHIANLRALTDDAILILAPATSKNGRVWLAPTQIRMQASADFCHDCATLLGYSLQSDLSVEDIYRMWEQMLKQRI